MAQGGARARETLGCRASVLAKKGKRVRPWILLAIVLFLFIGCSEETNTPSEQPQKKSTEKAHKEPVKEEKKDGEGEGSASKQESTPPQEKSPKEVLASQYEHINSGDYKAAYALFDTQSHQIVSLEQYKAYFRENSPYYIDHYSFNSVNISGDSGSVRADLSVHSSSGDDHYHLTQKLVRQDGGWRVVMRDEQVASFTSADNSSASASASPASGEKYDATVTVSRVVDGDTVEISPSISSTEDVRLIGVDTPETVDPDEEVEPYGPEASDFATSKLEGERVGLEFGQEKFDDYDRLLAYVYVDGQMFNEDLIEQGYAQTYPYEPNTKYADRFEMAQQEARASGLGIWNLSLQEQCQLANHGNGIGEGSAGCENAADGSTSATATTSASASAEPTGGVPPISEQDCPPSAPIKGNDSSSGESIYHTRSSATYDETYPEECFATEAAAQAAGYRKAMD